MTTKYSSPRSDSDGEVSFDDTRVELQQSTAITVVNRPTNRDQAENRPSLGVGSRRSHITACLRSSLIGTTICQPRPDGIRVVARLLDEIDDEPRHIGSPAQALHTGSSAS